MPKTQMNVRIDSDLKTQGDNVFRLLGLTATDVVQAVWGYAAEHGDVPCIVAQALQQPAIASEELDTQYRMLMVERAHNLVSDFSRQMNLPAPDKLEDIDYRAMREEGMAARLDGWGIA